MQTTPPLSAEPLRFFVPPIHHRTLRNGTPVHVIAAPNEDLVTITVAMRTGARHDVLPGETSITAQMLNRGTIRLNALAFAEEVERRGCSLRTVADNDACSVQASGLIEWFDDLVDLAAECLLTPRFDETELDKLRQRISADMMVDLVDVEWLAARACALRAYDGHPYARPRNGNPASLRNLTTDALRSAHHRMINAPRHIIVAGPVDVDAVVATLDAAFGGMPTPGEIISTPRSTMRARAGVVAPKNDAVQTAFRIALPCVSFDHPDYAAVQLVTTVLGGYTLARLFSVLREEKGYTYGAYAFSDVRPRGTTTGIVTSVGNDFTADTMDVIAEEVRRIGAERIDDEELENARQQVLGTFARSNETPQQTASLVWTMLQHELPFDYFERHVMRLQKLVSEDLVGVQERYFSTSHWVVGVSGNPDIVRPAIADYVDTVEDWVAEGYE
ncbi:MAG: pitrilysin family protein [Candidatus Kapabacteria bacterium]|nr:pitrilysin family protein [Candidatus Kapabacteria bacterium]